MKNKITSEDLECINTWPKGTVGHIKEADALKALVELCNEHGYGRIPQMAKMIEDI